MSIENPEFEIEKTEEKPTILYHTSVNGDIEEFEPSNKTVRDPNEGPVVFGMTELPLAIVMMSKEVAESGNFNGIPYAVIVGSREHFEKNDKGGFVYTMPSDTFENDPGKGLGKLEWTSKVGVKPTSKIEIPSRLQAMLENGVQVYFIDKATHEKIKESDDHGFSILQGLESENQKSGINVRLWEDLPEELEK